MIQREILPTLLHLFEQYPVVSVVGPRQSGKTTLARMAFPDMPYVSLEDPDLRRLAQSDPRGFLKPYRTGAIFDEIQRVPELLSYLQGIVDEDRRPGMFVITGSHQPELKASISQSLAGRTGLLTLLPFSLDELAMVKALADPWARIVQSAFPPVHDQKLDPQVFLRNYIQTYAERDVRQILNIKDLALFQDFLRLLAGRVGQILNYSSLSNDLGVSGPTIKSWIGVLENSYLVFRLRPWTRNRRKRVVKSPKLYFTDPGLAAGLLGIETAEQVERDPLRGALYENLMISEIRTWLANSGRSLDLHYLRDSNGGEIDLLFPKGSGFIPIEVKSAATPRVDFASVCRRFMKDADTGAGTGFVLYNGEHLVEQHGVRFVNLLDPQARSEVREALGLQVPLFRPVKRKSK